MPPLITSYNSELLVPSLPRFLGNARPNSAKIAEVTVNLVVSRAPPVDFTNPPVDLVSPLTGFASPLVNRTGPPVGLAGSPVGLAGSPVKLVSPPVG